MADAGIRRNNFEIAECFCAPAKECIALDVALKFKFGVQAKSVIAAEIVHLNGVIDHEFRREERINALRIAAHFLNRFAHRGKVHNRGNACEILQKNARGHESNFFLRAVGSPFGERGNVVFPDEASVFTAEEIFEEDAQGKGKLG